MLDRAFRAERAVVGGAERACVVGIVRQAWLRGERIDPHGEPHGRLLTRGQR